MTGMLCCSKGFFCGGSTGTKHTWKAYCSTFFSSCIYFLAGSSAMITVVHVSHGQAPSEQPQRLTLGLASAGSRYLIEYVGCLPNASPLDIHSQNWCLICVCFSMYIFTHKGANVIKTVTITYSVPRAFISCLHVRFSADCVFLWAIEEQSWLDESQLNSSTWKLRSSIKQIDWQSELTLERALAWNWH